MIGRGVGTLGVRISKQLYPKAEGSHSHAAIRGDRVFLEPRRDNRGHLRSIPMPPVPGAHHSQSSPPQAIPSCEPGWPHGAARL